MTQKNAVNLMEDGKAEALICFGIANIWFAAPVNQRRKKMTIANIHI